MCVCVCTNDIQMETRLCFCRSGASCRRAATPARAAVRSRVHEPEKLTAAQIFSVRSRAAAVVLSQAFISTEQLFLHPAVVHVLRHPNESDTGIWALALNKAGDLSQKLKMGCNYSWCGPDFIRMHQFVCSKH